MNRFASASSRVLGVLAGVVLLACGNEVIVEGDDTGIDPSDPITSSSSSSGGVVTDPPEPPPPSDPCTTICADASADHCACKRYCTDPTFTTPNAKIACAPLAEGSDTIQCVCTYGEDFSGVCYEKNGALCDFELGCCSKYFYGK